MKIPRSPFTFVLFISKLRSALARARKIKRCQIGHYDHNYFNWDLRLWQATQHQYEHGRWTNLVQGSACWPIKFSAIEALMSIIMPYSNSYLIMNQFWITCLKLVEAIRIHWWCGTAKVKTFHFFFQFLTINIFKNVINLSNQ